MSDALLQVRGLSKEFPIRGGILNRVQGSVRAVSDVSFDVATCSKDDVGFAVKY